MHTSSLYMLIGDPSPSLYLKKRSAIFPILRSFEVSPRSESTRARQLVVTYPGRKRKFSHLRKFAGLRRTFSSVGLVGSFGSQYPPGFCRSRISLAQPLRGIFEYASLTSGSLSLRPKRSTNV